MAMCQNCGAEVAVGSVKCAYCSAAVAHVPPAAPPQWGVPAAPPPAMPVGVEQKSKIVAGILAILLGALGIHNFYLGFTGKGLAQILITFLTCGYGALITGIWGLIEGIMILTGAISRDSRGIPLKD